MVQTANRLRTKRQILVVYARYNENFVLVVTSGCCIRWDSTGYQGRSPWLVRLGGQKVFWHDTDSKGQIALDVGSAQPRELAIGPDYVFDCRATRDSNLVLAHAKYSLDEIIAKGIVGDNLCGTATASPTPGALILFVRPAHLKKNTTY
jgi:hypothetical protein